jgi:hypothetical protein
MVFILGPNLQKYEINWNVYKLLIIFNLQILTNLQGFCEFGYKRNPIFVYWMYVIAIKNEFRLIEVI